MKRIITYVAAMTALVLAASCSRESMQDIQTGDGLSLQVMWTEMATRADEGEVNNEYAVNSLDWYFYKDTTAAPAFHYREAIAAGDAKALKYVRDFVPGQTYGGAEFPHRGDLCGADDYCTVFIVANLPADKVNATAKLADLKAIEVDETFLDGDSPLAPDAEALNFIMTGQKQVKGTSLGVDKATAEVIKLNRLAVKITYTVNVLKSRVETANGITETWTPMLDASNVRMYPQNVVKNALLGAVDELYPATLETANADQIVVSSDEPSKWTDGGTNYTTKEPLGPYYTYPNNWEEGGADTFIKIIVPWQVTRVQNGNVIYSAQREVYYKVLLPDPMTLSNTWYQLEINLAPGTENEPEVTVEAVYRVADWILGGEEGVDGVLKDIKYLIADRSDQIGTGEDGYFVTYTSGISIPYSASNPVVFQVMEASYKDFYTEKPTEKKFVQNHRWVNPTGTSKIVGTSTDGTNWSQVTNLSTVESWFKFDNGSTVGAPEGSLVMNHLLNGNLASDYFDVSPYTFIVNIYLQRDMELIETVKIIQYPQTYIDAQESSVKLGTVGANSAFIGYIFVNGVERTSTTAATNDGNPTPWTNITGLGSMYNRKTNHNMYILTTSVLSNADQRLGDPRVDTKDNGPKTVGNSVGSGTRPQGDQTPTFITAPAVGGGTRTLTNYYPTDPAKSPTFIAPKLRISSAFGRRGSNNGGGSNPNQRDDYRYNYASAWNRCAAYQEDGYPAGRWRLPTEAEIEYVNALSQRDFIPSLFYGSTPYWTATPGKAVANGVIDDGYLSASTRCVYDDWYWGSEPVAGAQSTFMWGD